MKKTKDITQEPTQELGKELGIEELEKFTINKDQRFSTAERILYNIMVIMEEIKEELKEEFKKEELARAMSVVDEEFEREFGLGKKEEVKKPEKKEAEKEKKEKPWMKKTFQAKLEDSNKKIRERKKNSTGSSKIKGK